MPPKSIIPHRHAVDDLLDAVDYYREHAGTLVAEKFSFEIDQALERLSKHPNIGSPRPALDLDIECIKSWALKRFPHQIFYEIQDNHVELWRILHPRRDITQAMLSRQRFQ
ncbi:type II toxin-antitoxin system RelE/ParE family toxin [Zwartia sp.]|uniref:type II toxin-antitoxin system RelE/ParE family toxin n=1 Tax=Zwartia sp. TaxID=2978004 RepID=UPI003BB17C7E